MMIQRVEIECACLLSWVCHVANQNLFQIEDRHRRVLNSEMNPFGKRFEMRHLTNSQRSTQSRLNIQPLSMHIIFFL